MTGKHKNSKHYISYTAEDFLQDDYFLSSIQEPTEESIRFWQEFSEIPDVDLTGWKEACKVATALQANYRSNFKAEEIDELWDRLDRATEIEIPVIRHSQKKKTFIRTALGLAAGIALLCIFLWPVEKMEPEDAILSFVEKNTKTFRNDTVVQVVVAEDKIVASRQKEVLIRYDSTEIKIADEKVALTEVASFNQLLVPNGKRSQLTLPDGTHIWVNSGTCVTYPIEFAGDKREIYVNGEIFLDVVPDEKRPFMVRTRERTISVLGTSFNVTAYEEEEFTRIVLVSGKVKIASEDDNQETFLNPNDKYELIKGRENVSRIEVGQYISWIKGMYEFDSELLEDVVKNISRYFGKEIVCSENIRHLKCSGKIYLLDEVEPQLRWLSMALPVKVEKNGGKYYIIEK